MRLPEAKIKEAILHPDKLVRQEALLYFAECYSRDTEVTPLAIKAIETFGRSNTLGCHSFMFLSFMVFVFISTPSPIAWRIDCGGDIRSYGTRALPS